MARQALPCTVSAVDHSELPPPPPFGPETRLEPPRSVPVWPAPSLHDAIAAHQERPRWSKSRTFGVAMVILLALTSGPLIAAISGKSGYAEVVPGPGIDVGAGVTGSVRDSEFPRKTGFQGLTVGIKEVSTIRYWWLSLRGVELMQLEDDRTTVSGVMMDQSQTIAAIVASEFVTGKQTETAVLVQHVVPGSPADEAGISIGDIYRTGKLAGDRTTQRFTEPLDVVKFVEAAGPGAVVTLDVERNGETRLVKLSLNKEGKMGVMLSVAAPDLAVGVEIDGVGGSSAGLTMTLALIDALSEGDLTAGLDVAATGEIGVDGSVYPIGGIAQKLRSDTARSADLVFVPATQDDVPNGAAVVRVGSVKDAVEELCNRGATDQVCDRYRL
jgi:PDZ domain-containing secreted protein